MCGTLPATAADALVAAKFDPTGVSGYGLGFICQIAGDPPDDSCSTTPPANAYWSFWYADAGHNTWTYSLAGAMNLEPQAGSVEAWVFGELRLHSPTRVSLPRFVAGGHDPELGPHDHHRRTGFATDLVAVGTAGGGHHADDSVHGHRHPHGRHR